MDPARLEVVLNAIEDFGCVALPAAAPVRARTTVRTNGRA